MNYNLHLTPSNRPINIVESLTDRLKDGKLPISLFIDNVDEFFVERFSQELKEYEAIRPYDVEEDEDACDVACVMPRRIGVLKDGVAFSIFKFVKNEKDLWKLSGMLVYPATLELSTMILAAEREQELNASKYFV